MMFKNTVSKPYVKTVEVGRAHYDEESRVLFLKHQWGLEPTAYDVKIVNEDGRLVYKGVEIEPNLEDELFLFLIFIRRCSERFDINGNRLTGFLETWQWNLAINEIRDLASLSQKDYVVAIARQAKVNWSV